MHWKENHVLKSQRHGLAVDPMPPQTQRRTKSSVAARGVYLSLLTSVVCVWIACSSEPQADVLSPIAQRARAATKRSSGIEVCHRTGSTTNPHRIVRVGSENGLLAHLRHGDHIFGPALDASCSGALTIRIDPSLAPTAPEAAGIDGGPPRPLAVIQGSDGGRDEYLLNEVQYRPASEADLSAFLQTYGGRIVRDDTVLIGTEGGGTREIPGGGDGLYLIEFETDRSPIADLAENAQHTGISGELVFPSIEALRSAALFFRERLHGVNPNILLELTALLEHPMNSMGEPIDFSTMHWMTDDGGLSIGVARAFDYLRDAGDLPPASGVWRPARVAVLDGGFDLDEETGLGNKDYNNDPFSVPLQVDAVDFDGRAGGRVSDDDLFAWHGQQVFSTCCAYPRNLFGAAGTGGDLVRPILIRVTNAGSVHSFDLHMGIRAAWLMGADVISMSVACKRGLVIGPLCALKSWVGGDVQRAVFTAISDGAAVFSAAGNGVDEDISDDSVWPCKEEAVICVGGVDVDGQNIFNWGDGVDIWAPGEDIRTTVTPVSAAKDVNDFGFDEVPLFQGTSAATPFVAGVAGLLKVVDPTLRWDDIQAVLQSTANCVGNNPCPTGVPDPHAPRGYVDALRAVQAVLPNPAPQVSIIFPPAGAALSWGSFDAVTVNVQDPPAPGGFRGEVIVRSDQAGELCRVSGDNVALGCIPAPVSPGPHLITATAIDNFGASAESSIEIVILNSPPIVSVLSPNEGASFFTSQLVAVRAQVIDVDETIPEANIFWTSSLDGLLNSGDQPRSFSTPLSAGAHVLTVRAQDAFGLESTDSVHITVSAGDGHPTAIILSPLPNTAHSTGATMSLRGQGTDPEDGELPDESLRWTSSVDGFLGTGRILDVVLTGSPCEAGHVQHTLVLEVTDSDGHTHTDSVQIQVGLIC